MALHEPRHELIVRLKARVVFALRIQTVDLTDMPSRVFVACGAAFVQRDLDESPAEQDRGQWVFAFEDRCGRVEQLIAIAVDFAGARLDQSGRALMCRPLHQNGQRRMNIRVLGNDIERPLFGLEVIEVGQPVEESAQM